LLLLFLFLVLNFITGAQGAERVTSGITRARWISQARHSRPRGPGDRITVRATRRARLMFLGGSALEGPRYIWWNFVSSRRERIDQAKEEWKSEEFAPVPGDTGSRAPWFAAYDQDMACLPVGTAYAVWVGVGAFGVAIAGMLALGENVSAPRLAFLALILVGIVGLKFLGAR
jgi:Pirin C-terminal cupin domain/Small Multidrug Resistance protein